MTQIEEKIELTEQKIEKKKAPPYSEYNRIAQAKYRAKYPERYAEAQKKQYARKMLDPNWKQQMTERISIYSKNRYAQKKQAKIDAGEILRPVGRPRKIIDVVEIAN